ncbi:MAG: T9SS type A sorting domain-containing protein [Saprospiraceae bacterium]|nr:T9SS type A sorting domain-containing protein [Saprospiraceae bacterium]
MNKILLLITVMFTTIVSAQKVAVIVNSPAGIAGEKTYGGAAFGADLTTQNWTGDCVLAEPIAACAALTNASSMAGKFAVIDRGGCNFDVKCLNAQDAGAIAVIVLNHNDLANRGGDEPFRMGSVNVGAMVTIPCVMLGYSDGVALKKAISEGGANMTIGSFPKEANDLTISRTVCDGSFSQPNVFHPKYGAIPSHQIKADGDMTFITGAAAFNAGSAAQNNVKVNCTIKNGTTEVYNKTSDEFEVLTDSTGGEILEDVFDYNGKAVGLYNLHYNVNSSATEKFSMDNNYQSYFNVSGNILSKSRFNMTTRTPVNSGAYLFGGGTAYRELMMPFRLKYGTGYQLDSIYTTVSTGTGGTVAGLYLEGRVYRWNDLNADEDISSDEMVLVSLGSITFADSDTRGSASFALALENLDGSEKVHTLKADNELYFASIQYAGGSTNVFFGYDNDYNTRPYFELKNALEELDFDDYPFLTTNTQDVSGGPDMSDAGLFYFDCNGNMANDDETVYSPASIAIHVSKALVNTKDISDEAGMKIEFRQNPVSDELIATIQLNELAEVNYNIVDMGGKVIFNAKENGITDTYNPTFNVRNMSPGQYILQVNTDRGFIKKAFIVVR